MEELSYTSKFDGETTDDILGYANEGKTEKVNEYVKSMNVQDSKGEPDTVQVYDTDGVPHKVSKTELLKKSTLALPKLEDISAFVAVNAKGDAVGVMTKEDIAKVLAELIGTVTDIKNGLQQAGTFRYLGNIGDQDLDDIGSGYGYSYNDGTGVYGVFLSFNVDCKLQLKCNYADGSLFTRTYNQSSKTWSNWKKIA